MNTLLFLFALFVAVGLIALISVILWNIRRTREFAEQYPEAHRFMLRQAVKDSGRK